MSSCAPLASPHEYTRLFAQVFGLSERTRAAMQNRFEAREGILMPQFEPQAVGPRISQATQDLGHRRILKDSAVLQEVGAFLA